MCVCVCGCVYVPGSTGGTAPRNGDWTGLEGPELGEYASSTSSRLLARFTPRPPPGLAAKSGGPHRFLLASGCTSRGLPNTSIGRFRVTHAMSERAAADRPFSPASYYQREDAHRQRKTEREREKRRLCSAIQTRGQAPPPSQIQKFVTSPPIKFYCFESKILHKVSGLPAIILALIRLRLGPVSPANHPGRPQVLQTGLGG